MAAWDGASFRWSHSSSRWPVARALREFAGVSEPACKVQHLPTFQQALTLSDQRHIVKKKTFGTVPILELAIGATTRRRAAVPLLSGSYWRNSALPRYLTPPQPRSGSTLFLISTSKKATKWTEVWAATAPTLNSFQRPFGEWQTRPTNCIEAGGTYFEEY